MSNKPALVEAEDVAPPVTAAGLAEMAALTKPIPNEPPPAADRRGQPVLCDWRVDDGDGHSGIVKAANKDAAKYLFMRQNRICDKQQQWTVTPA